MIPNSLGHSFYAKVSGPGHAMGRTDVMATHAEQVRKSGMHPTL